MRIQGVNVCRVIIAVSPPEKSQRTLVLFAKEHLMKHVMHIISETNIALPKAKEYTSETICQVRSSSEVSLQKGSLKFSSCIENNAAISGLVSVNHSMMS